MAKQNDDLQSYKDKIDKELGEQYDKIERAQKSFQAKFNNVRSVKGDAFQESKENYEILNEVEANKHKHLLSALQ